MGHGGPPLVSVIVPARNEAGTVPAVFDRTPEMGAGSKIGLFVARAVAEAQGGRAWGEVTDGRLAFHVELPTES